MGELTNLTDRISHLRDREGGAGFGQHREHGGGDHRGGDPRPRRASKQYPKPRERRFAADYFMVFVYALLGVALCTQFVLIAWLDLM